MVLMSPYDNTLLKQSIHLKRSTIQQQNLALAVLLFLVFFLTSISVYKELNFCV